MAKLNNPLLDFLFIRHREELVVFAEQKNNSQNAEDLVQEAYLRLLQHGDIQSIDNHRAYLYKVTANIGVDQYRLIHPFESLDQDEVDINSLVCPIKVDPTVQTNIQPV